jgi:succinate dehydrogenase / fumarate reductase, cytochrome b subunit
MSMNSNFINSSIGKKVMMSVAGIFLMMFLVVHLGINLLILLNDGGAAYSEGVHFMTTNIVVKVMEIVLFGGLFLHIIYAVVLQIKNWISRPVKYQVTYPSQTSFFSKYMIHTGVVILVFLCIHFMNFYFVKLGFTDPPAGPEAITGPHDFYHMVINLFSCKLYSWLYIFFMVFLSFHLNHAFQSAFQTLGLEHKKYTPFIKVFGLVYSIVVSLGFAIIPAYFLIFAK